ncbi:MAG TPA: DUF3467 domain-containing protein [Gemmatales bacterium]|nr:DUF3467 domain-containing protein [Gemmatales bacterium]
MGTESTTPPAGQQQPQQFPVDTRSMVTSYANFARVTGTPEELVLDFGLNTQMAPNPEEPVNLTHRLVLNFYTAKRLLMALSMALQQHENVYGVLEIDIQKRMRVPPAVGARPGTPGATGS